MKKLKISELPICTTLKGLFTIGTDSQNRSVKVSLQFVEDRVAQSVSAADKATEDARAATQTAQASGQRAEQSSQAADTAAAQAQTARSEAEEATEEARNAAQAADREAQAAKSATDEAKEATDASKEATAAAVSATEESVQATEDARAATEETLAKIAVLVPSALSVVCVSRLTLGNVTPVRIKAVLSPVTAMKNVIYISDGGSVEVSTDGVMRAVKKGFSRVHIIPTMNTALARTCLVEVGEPTLRSVSRTGLRLTQSGCFRLT